MMCHRESILFNILWNNNNYVDFVYYMTREYSIIIFKIQEFKRMFGECKTKSMRNDTCIDACRLIYYEQIVFVFKKKKIQVTHDKWYAFGTPYFDSLKQQLVDDDILCTECSHSHTFNVYLPIYWHLPVYSVRRRNVIWAQSIWTFAHANCLNGEHFNACGCSFGCVLYRTQRILFRNYIVVSYMHTQLWYHDIWKHCERWMQSNIASNKWGSS